MSLEGIRILGKEMKEKEKEQERQYRKNLINRARVDVFVKILDKHKSLPIERFSRKKELELLISDSKNIVEELFKD